MLHRVPLIADPTAAFADELFGGLLDLDAITKRRAETEIERRERTQARVGLASNVVGLTAGTAGLVAAAKDPRLESSRTGRVVGRAGRAGGKLLPAKVVEALQRHPGKAAGAAVGLQGLNLAGDAVANRVLARSAKEPKAARDVAKAGMGELVQGHLFSARRQTAALLGSASTAMQPKVSTSAKPRVLTSHPASGAPLASSKPAPNQLSMFDAKGYPADGKTGAGQMPTVREQKVSEATERAVAPVARVLGSRKGQLAVGGTALAGGALAVHRARSQPRYDPYAGNPDYAKRASDVTFEGTFSKLDNDKQRAYGWASVVELDGQPVIDRQGDFISLDDIEEAAYTYVRKSRVAGDMHRRDGDAPYKAGELIESVVFTKEKCEAMGLPGSLAGKWWMGMQVEDPEVWAEVKKGKRAGFSIHGKGLRKDVSYDEVMMGKHR